MILVADRVVTPARLFAPGWVRVEDGVVVAVGAGAPGASPDVGLGDATIVPGFVDAHAHGGGGASFDDSSDAATDDDVAHVVATHRTHGTTTMMASLVSDHPDRLADRLRRLAPLVADGALGGIHLEGPWLSPRHAGAHDPAALRDPTPADVESVLAAADGTLRMVTLAPELPGSLDAVRRLTAAGVLVAIGHTDATYDQARAALDAGAAAGTHLFNAMRGLHHREPGPATALLEHPDAYVELVADGVHVHPAMLRLAANAKPHLTALVTDAMAAAGGSDGEYTLGSRAVTVRDGVARIRGDETIAGSTLTMARAVRYAVQVAGLPLTQAVRAASATPAAMLGLDRVGALRPGHHADLVVLDADLEVVRVMHRGAWV